MSDIALHLACSRATSCDYYSFDVVNGFFLQCGRVGFFTCSRASRGGSIPSSVILQGHDCNFLLSIFRIFVLLFTISVLQACQLPDFHFCQVFDLVGPFLDRVGPVFELVGPVFRSFFLSWISFRNVISV